MIRHLLPGLIVGLIFGAGLALSDMINPARVLAFLDVAGSWDPTLAFVMGGALVPSALGYWLSRRLQRPLMAREFRIPQNRMVEPQLLAGAAIFGIGWGLVGFCPGPAIAALGFGLLSPWLFVLAMLGGMLLHRFFEDYRHQRSREDA
jgi:uncharacterized membrane protein YedE/YeeE